MTEGTDVKLVNYARERIADFLHCRPWDCRAIRIGGIRTIALFALQLARALATVTRFCALAPGANVVVKGWAGFCVACFRRIASRRIDIARRAAGGLPVAWTRCDLVTVVTRTEQERTESKTATTLLRALPIA